MKVDTLRLLTSAEDIHRFVLGLWSDGPIKRSHEGGGRVHEVVERFARLPRFFYEASDQHIEWTHFSTWWGGILLCDYENPNIRDLRYLHEIYHGATMPNVANMNLATLEAKNFRNEREASTFTEMAIYLELPELRPQTFAHPIFVDRFLFPDGDLNRPDERMLRRWKSEPDLVFQELMYERVRIVSAADHEVDASDPQVVWLRRYQEQGANWLKVWANRYQLVEDAMIALRRNCGVQGRAAAARQHVDWLLSAEITDGTDIPFHREAVLFRDSFDQLIATYDRAMTRADQTPVKHRGEN
ncbi:MAG TPA: hypothetical protein VJ822_09395 [Dongiaceae bacterium]|nr:hypothetical protein [Dongiaceae bacterium]